jgi:hypothetical protein
MSPDGRSLGFITADLSLKRVSLADGLVTTVDHDAEFSAGAAWGADDRITFVRAGALWQVPASGGPAKQITTLDSGKRELLHAWPSVIAQGRILLFVSITGSNRGASHIEALSLATGRRTVIVESGTFPLYAPSGHLVFFRDGALLGAPFDVDRLEVTGPIARVLENLAVGTTMDAPLAALSNTGSLAYAPGDAGTTRLVWVSRQGVEQPITDTARRYQYPPPGIGRPADGGGRGWRFVDSGRYACDLHAADLRTDGRQCVSRMDAGRHTCAVPDIDWDVLDRRGRQRSCSSDCRQPVRRSSVFCLT